MGEHTVPEDAADGAKIQQIRRSNLGNGIRGQLLWMNGPKGETLMDVCLKDSFLVVCAEKKKKPALVLDMLVHVVLAGEETFTLLVGEEEYVFKPVNDFVSSWVFRLGQASLFIQKECLMNASKHFFTTVRISLNISLSRGSSHIPYRL